MRMSRNNNMDTISFRQLLLLLPTGTAPAFHWSLEAILINMLMRTRYCHHRS